MNYILLFIHFSDEVNGCSPKIRDFPVDIVNSQEGFLKDTLRPTEKVQPVGKAMRPFTF